MSAVTLPAGTTLGRSFEYGLDLNLGTTPAPSYQPVRRMSAWAPSYPPATQDQATYDDLGADNQAVTARSFATSFTVQSNRSLTTGLYLPEVEALLSAAKATLEGAVVDIRWYHKPEVGTPNPTDAGQAFCRVEMTRQNTGNAEVEVFNVTLTGQGAFTAIANPFAGWAVTTPIVASVAPDAAAVGELVTITGTGFLGATSVTFDAVAATDFVVANAATIIASMPAGSAGEVDVIVTTPGGASTAFPYTRGA